ncbi:MAG: SBBP repeat-containing protein [Planctomycetes bacterium]|nr:SBBP repeat-containing protein [Planctomycetota bacterium]
MRSATTTLLAAAVLVFAAADRATGDPAAVPTPVAAPLAAVPPASARAELAATRFVENRGQWSDEVRYAVFGSTAGWLHDDGFTLRFARHEARASARELAARGLPETTGAVVRTRFSGAAEHAVAGARLPGVLHFLRGNDPSAWRTDIAAFDGVTMQAVLPGIDVVYRRVDDDGERFAFAYDLALAPGAELSAFTASCEGAERVYVDRDGRLRIVVPLPAGDAIELTQEPPVAWQETAAGRRPLDVVFRVLGERTYGFVARDLDPALAAVVDPGVAWSTYLGGGASDSVNDLVWQPGIGIWLTGWAGSSDFPTTVGAYRTTGQRDAFVARLAESGTALQFATYFGGSDFEEGRAIAIGPNLRPTIVGFTDSPDLPVTPSAYQSTYGGGSLFAEIGDGFCTTLSAAGNSLFASTYLGGSVDDVAEDVAVDTQGNAYVCGWTSSPNFPTTAGSWQPALGGPVTGQNDAFVTKLAPNAQSAVYSTYIGGGLNDQLLSLELDPASGQVVAAGWTISANFPVTSLAYRTSNAGSLDMIVVRLAANGAGPIYSTFLGGVDEDWANGIDLAADGSVWIAGWTRSTNFPISAGAPQTTIAGEEEGVVCRLSANGQSLPFSTFLGGSDADMVRGVAVSGTDVLVVGEAGPGLPVTADALQPGFAAGTLDGFVTWYDASGAVPVIAYSSYAGGAGIDALDSVQLDSGLAVIGGWSFSADFPVTAGALQPQLLGSEDGVVLMLDLLADLAGGLRIGASPSPELRAVSAGEHEVLAAAFTNTTGRVVAVDGVRLLVAGQGFAPAQASNLRFWLDDPATSTPYDLQVGGPLAIVADDAEIEVPLANVHILPGADATLRATVEFRADTSAGTVELACAIVGKSSWQLRAFGAGTGPVVRILEGGRVVGPVLYAGALPGDGDGDGRFTVLDLRQLCSHFGSTEPLVDADGAAPITLHDVELTREGVLGRAAVDQLPASAVRGTWLRVPGVFPAGALVSAVIAGNALTAGCVSAREATFLVPASLPSGTYDLTLSAGSRVLAVQPVLLQ